MPVVVATITPLPQHREEVVLALRESVPVVHAEPGCQVYALHEAGDSFVFIEQWESDDALNRHNAGDAVSTVVAKIADKLADAVSIVVAQPIPEGDPLKGQLVQG